MSILEDKANEVSNVMANNGVAPKIVLDPLLIMAIISIIVQIISYFITNRKSPASALTKIQHPGIVEKFWLWCVLSRRLKSFPSQQGEAQKALYTVAENLTENDVSNLYTEVLARKGK